MKNLPLDAVISSEYAEMPPKEVQQKAYNLGLRVGGLVKNAILFPLEFSKSFLYGVISALAD